jgi:hypothetical protein
MRITGQHTGRTACLATLRGIFADDIRLLWKKIMWAFVHAMFSVIVDDTGMPVAAYQQSMAEAPPAITLRIR